MSRGMGASNTCLDEHGELRQLMVLYVADDL